MACKRHYTEEDVEPANLALASILSFAKFIRTGHTGSMSIHITGGMIQQEGLDCVSKHYVR